jgi:hypothetical protein
MAAQQEGIITERERLMLQADMRHSTDALTEATDLLGKRYADTSMNATKLKAESGALTQEQIALAQAHDLLSGAAGETSMQMAELFNKLVGNNSAMAEYNTILSGATSTADGASSSTQTLNEKLFAQIQAHTDNAAAIALAGVELGIFTQKEADAMLKAALLEEAIKREAAAWDGSAASLVESQSRLQEYITTLNEMPSLVETEVKTKYTSEGQAATPFSRGGMVQGGVPGRDSVPALLMPGERVLTVAQNRDWENGRSGGSSSGGGGGDTYNIYAADRADLVINQMARRQRERRWGG